MKINSITISHRYASSKDEKAHIKAEDNTEAVQNTGRLLRAWDRPVVILVNAGCLRGSRIKCLDGI